MPERKSQIGRGRGHGIGTFKARVESSHLDAGAGIESLQPLPHHACEDVKGLFTGAVAGVDSAVDLRHHLEADVSDLAQVLGN